MQLMSYRKRGWGNSMDEIQVVAYWLIKNLCLDTKADSAKYELNGFHDKEGNQYGDWEIIVRKKKEVIK